MAWACRNCGILFITLWIIYAHVVALALLFTTCTPSHALHGSMLSYAWLHHMYSTKHRIVLVNLSISMLALMSTSRIVGRQSLAYHQVAHHWKCSHADAYCCTSGMLEISGGRPDPPPLYLKSHELLSGGLLGAPFLKRGELQQRCRAVGHPPCNWPGNGGGVDVLILIRAGTVSKVHVLFLRVIVAAVGAAVICRSH